MITSFQPVWDSQSEILILGTMPSVQSLAKRQYYGNPRNQFWRLIYGVFGGVLADEYSDRVQYVLQKRIALWDVLHSCERTGSLDKDIKRPKGNDITDFLNKKATGIQAVCFNGKAAQSLFGRHTVWDGADRRISFHKLPSSSPASTIPFPEKLESWRLLRHLPNWEQ